MQTVLDEACLWLLDAAPDAMLIADAAGRIHFANHQTEALFGYTRDELHGQPVELLVPERYREGHVALREKYARHPRRRLLGAGLDLRGLRKDGGEVALDIGLSPVETAGGTMTIATLREMTQRQQELEALRQEEARLEKIVAAIDDVVWSISPDGARLLYLNPAWERLFGHRRAEVERDPGLWLAEVHPDDRALAEDSLRDVLTHGQVDLEYRIVRPDGEVRWVSDHATLVRDEQGLPVRIDGIGRDITRRKQAEERQAALLREVEAANEELKNFAYVVSHDLKAPLRAIGSLAEWISADYADRFDDEGREHMRLLIGRVRRMDALIDGILQYSRVGRVQEGRTEVDLDALVHEVVDSLAPPAHIRVVIDTPLPGVLAEPTRMQQLFQNLIGNAIKYLDKPQGEVHVGCKAERGRWLCSVRDNGPGIERRHFERIFQLFQTLAPRDRVESTGVGLALAKKIVELQGGRIWVESKVGEGSSFFFTLPKEGSGQKT